MGVGVSPVADDLTVFDLSAVSNRLNDGCGIGSTMQGRQPSRASLIIPLLRCDSGYRHFDMDQKKRGG